MALRNRAEQGGDPALVDEAVEAAEFAESMLPDLHPDHVLTLSALGRARRLRYERRGLTTDARSSVAARQAAVAVPTAPPEERAISALTAAEWATVDGDTEAATSSYAVAVSLLRQVAWHGMEHQDHARQLVPWRNIAHDAAAASALQAVRPDQAIELLEQGRSVLWGQYLQYRADTADLRTVSPALAARLHEVQTVLAARARAQ